MHLALAVAGLSVALARYPAALTAIRIAGGLYLLYLGRPFDPPHPAPIRQQRTASSGDDVSTRSALAQALVTNLLNPKAVLFFAAVLPQFLVPGTVPLWAQIVALGVLDIALGFVAWAAVVVLGVRLSTVLRRHRVRQWWDRVTGLVLGGVGGVGGGLVVTR